jgi:hypothetical protein
MSRTSWSGVASREVLTRKWPRVKILTSSGSLLKGVKGREFRHDSIWVRTAVISSKVIAWLSITLHMWCFMDFTAASHTPPKPGESGGMKCHCMPSWERNPLTVSVNAFPWNRSHSSFSAWLAPLKLVALSLKMFWHVPLLEINLRSAAKNALVAKLLTSSMCMALVAKHTNKAA